MSCECAVKCATPEHQNVRVCPKPAVIRLFVPTLTDYTWLEVCLPCAKALMEHIEKAKANLAHADS